MANPTIPFRVDAYNVYRATDTRNALIGLATVDLPEITFKSDTVTGSGFGGDLDAPSTNIEAMECTFNFNSPTSEVFTLHAPGTHKYIIRAAEVGHHRVSGMTNHRAMRFEVKGMTKSAGGGSLEAGAASESAVTLAVIEYGVFLDDKEVLYIDVINNIHRVNGIDYKARIREII